MNTPVRLGYVKDELGLALHEAALHGDRKKLKKILKRGVNVDYPNSSGQTALFLACYEGQEHIIDTLLQNGACPNERSFDGCTPVHASGYSSMPKILDKLIEAGGDLRLHDNNGRTVRDWVHFQADSKKQRKMMDFIDSTRHFAMTHSGRDLLLEKQSSNYFSTLKPAEMAASLGNLLRVKSSHKSPSLATSVHSLGFGKIYMGEGAESAGTMATIPLVAEKDLRHDDYGCTYNNGPFMVMESMMWNKTLVTVKRLHKDPPEGGQVDLLITENEWMGKLRHPNILLLMGVCQTNNLEGVVLLYERVGCGSLYSYLYQRVESMDKLCSCEILRQMADALLYLHEQNLLHCYVTSHSIQLITPTLAKLSNFEYMVENAYINGSAPWSKAIENKYLNAAYNWMAPEVIAGESPTPSSDLYSLCAVLWEVLTGMPPWSGMQAHDIKQEVVDDKTPLDISDRISNPFNALLKYGLSVQPKARELTVEHFRDVMAQVVVDYETMGEGMMSPPYKSYGYVPRQSPGSGQEESDNEDDQEEHNSTLKELEDDAECDMVDLDELYESQALDEVDRGIPQSEDEREVFRSYGAEQTAYLNRYNENGIDDLPISHVSKSRSAISQALKSQSSHSHVSGSRSAHSHLSKSSCRSMNTDVSRSGSAHSHVSQSASPECPVSQSRSLEYQSEVSKSRSGHSSVSASKSLEYQVSESRSGLSNISKSRSGHSNVSQSRSGHSNISGSRSGHSHASQSRSRQSEVSKSGSRHSQAYNDRPLIYSESSAAEDTDQHRLSDGEDIINNRIYSCLIRDAAQKVFTGDYEPNEDDKKYMGNEFYQNYGSESEQERSGKSESEQETETDTDADAGPSNPFKKVYSAEDEEIKAMLKKPPLPKTISTSSTATLNMLNRKTEEEMVSQPTVYGTLIRQLSQDVYPGRLSQGSLHQDGYAGTNYVSPGKPAGSSILPRQFSHISPGSEAPGSEGRVCIGKFSIFDAKNQLPGTRHSVAVDTQESKYNIMRASQVSSGSRSSWAFSARDHPVDEPDGAMPSKCFTPSEGRYSKTPPLSARSGDSSTPVRDLSRKGWANSNGEINSSPPAWLKGPHLVKPPAKKSAYEAGSRMSWACSNGDDTETNQGGSTVFKPASHRIPVGKSPNKPESIPRLHHFAFPECTQGSETDLTSPDAGASGLKWSRSPVATSLKDEDTRRLSKFKSESYMSMGKTGDSVAKRISPQRVSPREQKSDWYGGDRGSIRNLISSFQDHVQEHLKKQSVLQMRNSRKTTDTKLGPYSLDVLATPRRRDYKVLNSMEGNKSTGSKVSTAELFVQKTINLTPTRMEGLADRHKLGKGESLFCPAEVSPAKRRSFLESKDQTEREVGYMVDNVIRETYEAVLQEYSHPECPHKDNSLLAATSMLEDDEENGQHSSMHHRKNISTSTGNSSYEAVYSTVKRDSSEFGSSLPRRSDEIEDFYFDDEINPEMCRDPDKHMRLQSTMALDHMTPPPVQVKGQSSRPQQSNGASQTDTTFTSSESTFTKMESLDIKRLESTSSISTPESGSSGLQNGSNKSAFHETSTPKITNHREKKYAQSPMCEIYDLEEDKLEETVFTPIERAPFQINSPHQRAITLTLEKETMQV